MFKCLLTSIFLFCFVINNVSSKPFKEELEDYEYILPVFPKECIYGKIKIEYKENKKNIYINGEDWMGEGYIRKDSKLELKWTGKNSGTVGCGVYKFNYKTRLWEGYWGWIENSNINVKGEIEGAISKDILKKVKK